MIIVVLFSNNNAFLAQVLMVHFIVASVYHRLNTRLTCTIECIIAPLAYLGQNVAETLRSNGSHSFGDKNGYSNSALTSLHVTKMAPKCEPTQSPFLHPPMGVYLFTSLIEWRTWQPWESLVKCSQWGHTLAMIPSNFSRRITSIDQNVINSPRVATASTEATFFFFCLGDIVFCRYIVYCRYARDISWRVQRSSWWYD